MTNKLDCVLHVNEKIEQFWLNCAVVVEDKKLYTDINLVLYLIKLFQVIQNSLDLFEPIQIHPSISEAI